MLYPLKFAPVFKEKIWGGTKLKTSLNLDFSPLSSCGESWMLSGFADNQTMIVNGFLAGNDLNEILEIYMDELVGERVYEKSGNEFPVLVKFIDASDWLSVQVHPGDALAASRGIGSGKTEMWYVLDAAPDAQLISGFNRETDAVQYLDYMKQNRLKEILNVEKVEKGDAFFIPSGRVHALGPGILIAEIQQTSDTTYRIYDWDRMGTDGKPRELHNELAVDAIDFSHVDSYRTQYEHLPNQPVNLALSPYFTVNLLEIGELTRKDYSALDSFVIYICVAGKGEITEDDHRITLTAGEVLLLPAVTDEIFLHPDPNIRILEVYVP